MNKFVNRIEELQSLEKEYSANRSSFVVVYGRRRVGKTALLTKFIEKHQDSIYFLATEENEIQNLNSFKSIVGQYIKNPLISQSTIDWVSTFKYLIEYKSDNKKIIVIDEFQYLCQSNNAFASIMQKIWDTLLKESNVMLILCGSHISLMKSLTLDYSSPLYGRRTSQIRLKQIPFKYYKEFYKGLSNNDLIEFYAVTGGIPKYIESFRQYNDIYQAILDNVLNEQSFLYEEPYFLLQKEVKEIGSYFSLIKTIAQGKRKLSDIATSLEVKQTNLTKYLKVLIDLDILIREVPVTEDKPEKSKSGLYRISDNFIAFWFKFVYPYLSYLEKGEKEYVLNQIKKGFVQNYASFVYEDICREKMWELSVNNTIPVRFEKVGRYWNSKAKEIDIVGIDTLNNNLVLGECKYSTSKKGIDLFSNLKKAQEPIVKLINPKNIYYVFFSTAGFTSELKEKASKDKNIILIDSL